jgi:hypothetical protein
MLELLAVVQVLETGRGAAVVALGKAEAILALQVGAATAALQEARRVTRTFKHPPLLLWVGLVGRVVQHFTPNLAVLRAAVLLSVLLLVGSRFTAVPVVVVVAELVQATPTSAARVGATVTPT